MLKVGFFGDGLWARLALKKILSNPNFLVSFVVLRYNTPDEQLRHMAESAGLPCFEVKNVNSEDFLSEIKKFGVDINVSLAFNQIFKSKIINLTPKKMINCHAGALPFYRGRNILNWAIINGEKKFAVTVHYIDEGIDTGDIILQRFCPIDIKDHYADVLSKAQKLCSEVLYDALVSIDKGDVQVIKQSNIHPVGFYCSERKIGDEYINWNWSSKRIYNFIRGISAPAPGARTFFAGKEYIIEKAELIDNAPDYIDKVGNIVGKKTDGIVIKTGDNTVLVTRMVSADTHENLDLSKLKIGQCFCGKNY